MLDEGELWPFGMFFPELEDGFRSFKGAFPSEMEKFVKIGFDFREVSIR